MNIGDKIKELRIAKGTTQEEFAEFLGVSYQAVSKWENNKSMPDISILPNISIYFGITIDDLFTISDEEQIERIDDLLENTSEISDDKFKYFENYLLRKIEEKSDNAVFYRVLASLYNHRSGSDRAIASKYSKICLSKTPFDSEGHGELVSAENGSSTDWYSKQHYELIDYYYSFLKKTPKCIDAYLFLIEQLIGDRRLNEAKKVLKQMNSVTKHHLSKIYEGDIYLESGDIENACKSWDEAVIENKDNWKIYFAHGDCMAKIWKYEKAIEDYKMAVKMQPKPRYIDSCESLARLYELMENYSEAINYRKLELEILQNEHKIHSGRLINASKREIERLSKLEKEVLKTKYELKSIGLNELKEVAQFSWKLYQNLETSSYPRFVKEYQQMYDNLKSYLEYKENEVVGCYDGKSLIGVMIYCTEIKERYAQTEGYFIEKDFDKVSDMFIHYIRDKYKGFEMLVGFPKENKSAMTYFEKNKYECIESAYRYELDIKDFSCGDIDSNIMTVGDDIKYEYLDFHKKYGEDMYWNTERVKEKFNKWLICVYRPDNEIKASVMMTKLTGEENEIKAFFNDGVDDDKLKQLLSYTINESLCDKTKLIVYFIEELSEFEKKAAESIGFKAIESYKCFKIKC